MKMVMVPANQTLFFDSPFAMNIVKQIWDSIANINFELVIFWCHRRGIHDHMKHSFSKYSTQSIVYRNISQHCTINEKHCIFSGFN